MTWRGALRSLEAAARRAERESRRRHNELERQRKQLSKMLENERAAYEVAVYQNHVEMLRSIHKERGPGWDWVRIKASPAPNAPTKLQTHETSARSQLRDFRPTFIDKLFGRVESKRQKLADAVEAAIKADDRGYRQAMSDFDQQLTEWKERQKLADRVISGDLKTYLELIDEVSPLREISELGSKLEFRLHNKSTIEVTLQVNGEEVVPSETRTQLKSGKLSVKKMPQGQFYELYQDYVSGSVLRVARELFALLPFTMTIINATAKALDPQTGHMVEQPILSVAIPRQTLNDLNLGLIDPSDSLKNFVHEMDFKKTTGFKAVKKLDPSMLSLTQ